MWLMGAVSETAHIEHFNHYCRKFSWTALDYKVRIMKFGPIMVFMVLGITFES